MIELIPAIDLIEGKCVRLTKGDYDTKKIYAEDPIVMAQHFEQIGFRRLHVVDLDGAKSKHVVNLDVLRGITSNTHLKVDFGGGIKTDEDLEKVLEAGASMVTIGSIAISNPELYLEWLNKYGAEHLILGADVRNGRVSINGWKEDSDHELIPFLKKFVDAGVTRVLCTDISRDGMLSGPSVNLYKEILKAYPGLKLIASGGVRHMGDVETLEHAGLHSVIIGKAIYEESITLKEINRYIQKHSQRV